MFQAAASVYQLPDEHYSSICCWCAERDIAAGEQVLISYGDLSDARLLQTYGTLGPECSCVCAVHRYKCRSRLRKRAD